MNEVEARQGARSVGISKSLQFCLFAGSVQELTSYFGSTGRKKTGGRVSGRRGSCFDAGRQCLSVFLHTKGLFGMFISGQNSDKGYPPIIQKFQD